jgi:hypothetical protein
MTRKGASTGRLTPPARARRYRGSEPCGPLLLVWHAAGPDEFRDRIGRLPLK